MNSSAEGIGCFKCASENGSNPACDDPFHNNYTDNFYERPCMGGRKNRNGLFPASSCIKMTGYYSECNFTGCSNWIYHRKLKKYSTCFLTDVIKDLSTSMQSSFISCVKFSWTTLYEENSPEKCICGVLTE